MVQNSIDLLEKITIGCLYIKPKLCEETYLKEEYFSNNYLRLIFKFTMEYYKNHKQLDLILIFQNYQNQLGTNFVSYMSEILTQIASATVFESYEETLFENYKNNLIVKYVKKFINNEINKENLFENLEKIKNMVANNDIKFYTADEIYHIVTKEDKRINTRLYLLNEIVRLTEHDFMVIGARPGVGKTGFALNLLEDLSQNYNCLYFNMEMSEQQLLRRIVSINSGIPIKSLGKFESKHQNEKAIESTKELEKRNLKIITGIQNIQSIKQNIIKESKKGHVIAFIDYVGLIASPKSNKTLYEKTTAIVKELRQISMNFDCTIIALAQINRNGESRNVPLLSDLKDSGELEQSAVSVLLLHNENPNTSKNGIEELQLIIAKNRNGKTGTIAVNYDKNNQRIEEKRRF